MAHTTVLCTPPRKAWLLVAAYAPGFLAAATSLFRTGLFAAPGLVFFGWLLASALLRVARPRPVLELDAYGFVQRQPGLRRRTVQWDDVAGMRASSFLGKRLRVDVRGARPVWITGMSLPITVDELQALMEPKVRDAR
ncbi:MAG TPA: hypothetical protein VHF47_00050 [Acidimicrobiales bacterium]|nr:hypothetical protein [Acidimicrobiales bacterium]